MKSLMFSLVIFCMLALAAVIGMTIAVMFMGCATTQLPEPAPKYSSTVLVSTQTDGLNAGTAFWVGQNHLLTAAHVAVHLDHDLNGKLIMNSNYTKYYEPKIVAVYLSEEYDLALIEVNEAPPHEILSLCDQIYAGEYLVVLGMTPDMGPDQVPGQLFHAGEKHIFLFGDIRPGFSGGPVLSTARSCVLGMLILGDLGQRQGIAISPEVLREFLEKIDATP